MNKKDKRFSLSALQQHLIQLYHRLVGSESFTAATVYIIGMGVDYLMRFGALRVFTNILSPTDIGIVAIFSSWTGIFNIILNFNLRGCILNAKTEFEPAQFKEFVSSIMTLGLLGSAAMSLIILLLPDFVYHNVFGLSRPLIAFALLVSTINFGLILTIQIWRAYNKSIIYSIQSILKSGYSIILSVIFIGGSLYVSYFSQVEARIIGMSVINILLGLYFIWRRLSAGGVFFNRRYWRYGLAISIPMTGHILSTQVLNRADQILIQNIIGEAETGIYSLAYRIGEIPSLLLVAFGSVWGVWFFDRMKNREYAAVREKSVLYALGFSVAVLGFMVIGPFLLQIITPPEYWSARRLIPIIMAGIYWMMLYSLFGNAEQYDKKMQYLAIATAIAAVFNVVANILLLPRFGYQAAAWTTVASYMLMALIHIWVVRFVLKRPNLFRSGVLVLIGIGITFVAGFLYIII